MPKYNMPSDSPAKWWKTFMEDNPEAASLLANPPNTVLEAIERLKESNPEWAEAFRGVPHSFSDDIARLNLDKPSTEFIALAEELASAVEGLNRQLPLQE